MSAMTQTDDMAEELFENFATELEAVAKRYAAKIRELYKKVRDPQILDSSVDWVLSRVIRALEQETGYYFDVASVNNISDYLERRIVD
jgi:hypothetical protein